MSQSPGSRSYGLTAIFFILLGFTITVWLLRGFGILTFIPGGSLLVLILLSLMTGILSHLQSRWSRF
ncbi:MAG: hypothetical protein JOZ78_02540 [Chroococcidiopsidaceae cyanobacterium CP_BM_ER_R8_30]|nr:hypothetical protein [Chroococcidiopsidaceae cyanobacterium CP_BM_ER_R8_30]